MRWIAFSALWAICSLSVLACDFRGAEASVGNQGWDHYAGRRVYVTSLIYDYKPGRPTDASVSVMGRAAAPLAWVEPRVNDSFQSVTEFEASMIRTYPARKAIVTYQSPKLNVELGGDFVWDSITLGQFGSSERTVCDVGLGQFARSDATGTSNPWEGSALFRSKSRDCRILTHTLDYNTLKVQTADVTRPAISLNWLDERGNSGSYAIEGAMVQFPGPSVHGVEAFDQPAAASDSSIKAIMLDPYSVCNVSRIGLVSLGIQSGRPGDGTVVHAHKDSKGQRAGDDYFDGQTGRRIAGRLMTCQLASDSIGGIDNIKLLLSELTVFISLAPIDLETKVRPVLAPHTKSDVSSKAYFKVLNNGRELTVPKQVSIPKKGSIGYQPIKVGSVDYPSAYFIADASGLTFEDKPEDRPDAPDVAKIDIVVTFEHTITVERPQLVTVVAEERERSKIKSKYWRSCSCNRSSGGGGGDGCSCSCSCSLSCNNSGNESKYCYEDHVRLENADDMVSYEPGSEEAKFTFVFTREVKLEPIYVSFDKPYEALTYVEPTPIPATSGGEDYVPVGGAIRGAAFGDTELLCSTNIDSAETGWVYVSGSGYAGCRPDYACCADIPRIENACADKKPSEQLACQTRGGN